MRESVVHESVTFEEGYKFTYQFQTAGPYTIPAKSGYEAAQITPIVGGSGWGMISAMRGGTGNQVYFLSHATWTITANLCVQVMYVKA